MNDTLADTLATGTVPADLSITYNDMHGPWGGVTITVRGDGSVERCFRVMGESAAQVRHSAIDHQT
ncbi:MAG TPA: hypothetical protein VFX76_16085, partial [Roseiflexaceae bacterium]|nr:hypothetical protein [Roseiflexaceae bacterium]